MKHESIPKNSYMRENGNELVEVGEFYEVTYYGKKHNAILVDTQRKISGEIIHYFMSDKGNDIVAFDSVVDLKKAVLPEDTQRFLKEYLHWRRREESALYQLKSYSSKKESYLSKLYQNRTNEDLSQPITQITKEEYEILCKNYEPIGLFYMEGDGEYIGIDNSTGDLFVENFNNEKECMAWLRKEFNIDSLEEYREKIRRAESGSID